MKDWQQRIIDEKNELDEKTIKLERFINGNLSFDALTAQDQELLKAQLEIMKAYIAILIARMHSLNIEEK